VSTFTAFLVTDPILVFFNNFVAGTSGSIQIINSSSVAVELDSVAHFSFYDNQVYTGYTDASGNQILARFGNADTTPTAYYKTFIMSGSSSHSLHAV
jgi:hypothetical protein